MSGKSNLDVVYDLLLSREGAMSFESIWKEVVAIQGYTEEEARKHIVRFYTNLTLDGRFVTLGENVWDLRTRHTFDKVHIDMNDVYRDVETDSEEEEEEELEYKKMLDDTDDVDIFVDDEDEVEEESDEGVFNEKEEKSFDDDEGDDY